MPTRVLAYRLYRLRRLILVSMVLPVLVVLTVALFKGQAALALLVLGIGLPLAHLLRYPTAMTETLTVSLVVSILLALAGTVGPDVGLLGLALRLVGLVALGFALFFVLSLVVSYAQTLGPNTSHTFRARRRTSLPPDVVKAAITIYPGRADDLVSCGPADEDGAFAVTVHRRVESPCETSPLAFDIEMFAQVLSSTEDAHEIMCVEAGIVSSEEAETDDDWSDLGIDPDDAATEALPGQASADVTGARDIEIEDDVPEEPPTVTVTRHTFTPTRRGGTIVEVAETGSVLTRGMVMGMWLQDYFADHLTDAVDHAEGRLPRANVATSQAQFIVDLGRRFMRSEEPAHPAE
ncbi:MAG: hypothetical protein AAF865_09270 [Pseudomonadota bacterium]